MKKLLFPKENYDDERLQGIFRHAEAAVKIEGEKGDIYLPAIPLLLLRGGTKWSTLSMKYSTEKKVLFIRGCVGGERRWGGGPF